MRRAAWSIALVLAVRLMSPLEGADVPQRIQQLAKQFSGELGVFAKHLGTGETIAWNADKRFPAASVIKVAIMAEAFDQIAREILAPDAVARVRGDAKVGGSGILRELHDDAEVTVRDLIRLMIVLSDNTATNLLLERVGVVAVNTRMDALGLKQTRIFRPTFASKAVTEPALEPEFGLGMSTPREMANLLELIARERLVSAAASKEMLQILVRQQDDKMIRRHLPFDRMTIVVGNKTGTDAEKLPDAGGQRGHVRSDAGIVRARDVTYVIAIFARRVKDVSWTPDNAALVAGARVSRIVFDRFVTSP
jgi:beta-lactamase class A